MGWYTDLSANIQAEIEKKSGVQPFFEVIIDPSGRQIRLDRLHDAESIGAMGISRSMEPDADTVYTVDDITSTHYDPDNYFCPSQSGGIFRDRRAYLRQDHSAGTKTLHLTKGVDVFEAGDVLRICSNGNTEEPIVDAVDVSGANEDIVTLVSGLSYSHTGGTRVHTKHIVGQSVNIQLGFDGITDTLSLYTGYLHENIEREEGRAVMKIRNASDLTLRRPITIQSVGAGDFYEHTYESSMIKYDPSLPRNYRGGYINTDYSYIMSSAEIGTIDHTAVVTYTGCPLGEWLIEFTKSTDFTVTGPGCFKKSGKTSQDFFDKTDASDSYIKIPSSVWTNFTGTEGDWVKIYVCIHYIAKTVPQIIYDLLRHFGGISTSNIDASSGFGGVSGTHTSLEDDEPQSPDSSYSFDSAFIERKFERVSICFYEPITVLEAIQAISNHSMVIAYPDKNEVWKLHSQFPRPLQSAIGTVSDTTNLIDVKVRDYAPTNEITAHYAFKYRQVDPASGTGSEYSTEMAEEYMASYTYPETDDDNQSYLRYGIKNAIELECPGIYTEAMASAMASRYWLLWKDGLREIELTMTLEGINLEIGDRVTLQCSDPDIDTTIEVFSVQFVPDSCLVEVKGFDTKATPESFAIVEDTTQRRGYTDEGFMVW